MAIIPIYFQYVFTQALGVLLLPQRYDGSKIHKAWYINSLCIAGPGVIVSLRHIRKLEKTRNFFT